MRLVDTHCHLNFQRYDHDRAETLQRARDAGVQRVIIPAIDLETCRQALELTAAAEDLFAAVGIHPNNSADFEKRMLDDLREFAREPRAVAIGEIGLDYHWERSPKPAQWRALEAQLNLATEFELPVIVHNREASADLLPLLASWAPSAPDSRQGRLGVLHSFSASGEVAQSALDLGFYLGITGPITYKKSDELRAIARRVPLDRILIETDGPFLAPEPKRGKRNEPAYVRYVNDRLAQLRDLSPEAMARKTTANAEGLFGLA